MSDIIKVEIDELVEATTPNANDELLIKEASTGVAKKIKASNLVSDAVIQAEVDAQLAAHPEWTTTVEDGSITVPKLASDVVTALANKANIDGYYDEMAVGSAEQLLSNTYEEDNAPYLFRTSGGSLEIGDRVYEDAIVGGSVAWNQLVQIPSIDLSKIENGVTITDNRDGSYTISTTAEGATADTFLSLNSSVKVYSRHKYYLFGGADGGSSNTYYAYCANLASINIYNSNGRIISQTSDKTAYPVIIYVKQGTIITTPIVSKLQLIDLTLMFGSTIANYVYTLEQSEVGSGIAWLKSQGFFTKDYYAYNAGGIKSVKTSAKKVVGFNQWDEQWELGKYDTQGEPEPSSIRIRTKNYIPVFPNVTYYLKSPNTCGLRFYDVSKQSLGSSYNISVQNNTFTTPANAYYLRFSVANTSTYNHDICLNFHWDGEKDGEYESYEEHTYPLDSDLELRGIPKLVDGKIKYDGDTYASDGTVTRKYGIIDLGSKNWSRQETSSGHWRFLTPASTVKVGSDCRCAEYQTVSNDSTWNGIKGVVINSTTTQINVCDESYSDAATFKTAMSGVYLVYELATPTTESADPYTNPQLISNWGTEEFVDERNVPVPVGHDSRYLPNLKAKVESAPNNPSTNGDYLVRHNNGENSYVTYISPIPTAPSEDGNYKLRCTVANNTSTLSYINDIGPELASKDGVYNIYQINNKLSLLKYDSPDYYGFIIHQNTASPTDRVEYIGLNKDYTPMSMGSDGVVNKGSWSSMPTIVKNKPAMVKWGIVKGEPIFDYWLDEDDYTKKADGTASDVSNTSYQGGAFSWFEPIWMKVTAIDDDIEVRFAYYKLEDDYFEVCPEGCGLWLPMFYSGRHSVTSGKASSLAGVSCLGGDTTATQWSDIQAASPSGIFVGGKLSIALYYLGCMWFKSTNSDVWGIGNRSGYDSTDTTTYGTKVNPIVGGGQFYATSTGNNANKFLHSVALNTYDVWLRDPYTLAIDNKYAVSLDYTYDITGAAYYKPNISVPAAGYPKKHIVIALFGAVPYEVGGSNATYYCDYLWVTNTGTRVALRFGSCAYGAGAGGSALALGFDAAGAGWALGFAYALMQKIS